jgi:glycosyltransferase involved in cell wall biosynthesis
MVPGRILVVGLDSTGGWSAAAADFVSSLRRAGAEVHAVGTGPVPRVRTFALTDFTQALLARRAALRGIAEYDPEAIVYFSVTAALLWPRRGAISLDSIAAENRPGRHGLWQRPVERRRLRDATLLLTWSESSLAPLRTPHAPALLVPPPVAVALGDGAMSAERDLDVVTYAADPVKRRLDQLLAAWDRARREQETLTVTGLPGFTPPAGVASTGRLGNPEFRALLRRAKVFVAAPQREDHGIAALEALAAGCMLVTTPAPGPYPACDIARELDPRLVTDELVPAIRAALDEPLPGYADRAAALLAPFAAGEVDRTIREQVLPRLLAGWTAQTEVSA